MSELTDTQLYPASSVLSVPTASETWPGKASSDRVEALLNAADTDLVWQDTLTRYWPLVMLATPTLVLVTIIGWVSRP